METMEKISVSDLSVGDWVYVQFPDGDKWSGRIVSSSDTGGMEVLCSDTKVVRCTIHFICPIPISTEVLEKNGFEENCGRWYNSEALMEFEQYKDGWCRTINCGEYSVYFIKYVHQLQRALKLEEIEKEIIL